MTPEQFDAIIGEITGGTPTYQALRNNGVSNTAFYTLLPQDERAAERYARAKQAACQAMADEILDIADAREGEVMVSEDGVRIIDNEAVARARLRVDSRKWLLSKLLPKVYGEKPLDLNLAGKIEVTMGGTDRDAL